MKVTGVTWTTMFVVASLIIANSSWLVAAACTSGPYREIEVAVEVDLHGVPLRADVAALQPFTALGDVCLRLLFVRQRQLSQQIVGEERPLSLRDRHDGA